MKYERLVLLLAAAAALAGWALLAYTVFGPTYSTTTTSLAADGSQRTVSGSASMLQMGISPLLAGILIAFAAGYGAVLAGAWLISRGRPGRWLMLLALLPMVAINSISFGLATLLPATGLAAVTTLLAFTAQPKR